MKSFRLLGLFLVSLFLAACWLSSLPAAEHPWDEDEVVASDSNGTATGNGGDDYPGDIGGVIIILPAEINFARPLASGMLFLHKEGGFNVRKGEVHQSSLEEAGELGTVLPAGRILKSGK